MDTLDTAFMFFYASAWLQHDEWFSKGYTEHRRYLQ